MIRFFYRFFLALLVVIAVALVAFRFAASNRETLTASGLLLPESLMVETPHGALHALVIGPEDGPPVLLIHGSVGWSDLWRPTMKFLADQGYRAIALDLPPMGLSARDTRMDFSRQAQGLRILGFVDALEVKPIVIAHSFGAGAVVEAVMATPQAFSGAVIVAGALGLGQDGTDQQMPLPLRPTMLREAAVSASVTNPFATKMLFQQFVHRKDMITNGLVETLEYPFKRQGTTPTLAAWLPTLLVAPSGASSSVPDNYAKLDIAVALIWGREDTVTPPDQAEALRLALGDAPLFWMNNVGHIPQVEAPQEFHDLLVRVLEELEKG